MLPQTWISGKVYLSEMMPVVVSPSMSESLGSVEPPVLLLSTRLDSTRLHSNTVDGEVWQNQLIIANLGPHLASVVFITALQG